MIKLKGDRFTLKYLFNNMNYKDFPKHPIDYIISILICFCVLFLCFVFVDEYPYHYDLLDFRRIFNAVKISGFITLYLIIGFILSNERTKAIIPSLIRYFLALFFIFLIVFSCNLINYR